MSIIEVKLHLEKQAFLPINQLFGIFQKTQNNFNNDCWAITKHWKLILMFSWVYIPLITSQYSVEIVHIYIIYLVKKKLCTALSKYTGDSYSAQKINKIRDKIVRLSPAHSQCPKITRHRRKFPSGKVHEELRKKKSRIEKKNRAANGISSLVHLCFLLRI